MRLCAALSLLCLAACGSPSHSSSQLHVGQKLVDGAGQDLLSAAGGGAAAYVREPVHPKGPLIPEDAFIGELVLIAADGQQRSLGSGVTNLPGSMLFSPDGRYLAFLRHFDFASHLGELVVADVRGGDPKPLTTATSFFGFSPDSRNLAYVSGGRLWVMPLAAGVSGPATKLGDGVATFEFSADGQTLLSRQRSSDGAELVLRQVGGDHLATTVAKHVADYKFDQKGQAIAYTLETPDRLPELHLWKAGAERLLGTGAPSFSFAPDGRSLAFVAGVSASYIEGDIYVVAVDGGTAQRLGKRAGAYLFSPDGTRLGFLHDFYDQAHSGKLAVWSAAGGVQEITDVVRLFGWSHRGGYFAWLKTVTHPLYTERLYLSPAAKPAEGRFVGQAIYSFDFTPDDKDLLFKTDCVSGGAACDLMEVPTDAAQAEKQVIPHAPDGGLIPEKATRVAAGLSDYDYSADNKWMWLAFTSPMGHVIDLAVIPTSEWSLPRYIDHGAEPHPRWLSNGKVAYLINSPKKAGFYVADPAQAVSVAQAKR
jgi:hypothetical protein